MKRHSVVRTRGSSQRFVVYQSDFLSDLPTRFVIPLIPVETKPPAVPRLNPTIELEGRTFVLATQSAASAPIGRLESTGLQVADQHDAIRDALDFLFSGF